MMVSRKDIQATCDDIVREFKPLQVILFGSYAYGTPKEYSDVDLLVVMPVANSETRNQAVENTSTDSAAVQYGPSCAFTRGDFISCVS